MDFGNNRRSCLFVGSETNAIVAALLSIGGEQAWGVVFVLLSIVIEIAVQWTIAIGLLEMTFFVGVLLLHYYFFKNRKL